MYQKPNLTIEDTKGNIHLYFGTDDRDEIEKRITDFLLSSIMNYQNKKNESAENIDNTI